MNMDSLKLRARELPADVQNERQIAMLKLGVIAIGMSVTLLWFSEPEMTQQSIVVISAFIFGIWGLINGAVWILLKHSRHVRIVAMMSTVIDVFAVALLDVAVLLHYPLNFITSAHTAIYFAVISASSVRHNSRLVRTTAILCAIAHFAIVLCCYLKNNVPIEFILQNDAGQQLRWMLINDALISLGMAIFGIIVGQATHELISSEKHYLELFHNMPDGIVIVSAGMRILASNRKFQQMVDMTEFEIQGKSLQQFLLARPASSTIKGSDDGSPESLFSRLYGKNCSIPVQVTQSHVDWGGQRCIEFSCRDMSERYELELALARAQKIQVVGKLAGDLAHDFNNILAGIFGSVSLSNRIIGKLHHPEYLKPVSRYLETIADCGETAAHILERLNSFSRSAIVETSDVDIQDVLTDTVAIIQNTLPSHIAVQVESVGPLNARADKTSLTQAILNLCINAKDAIGESPGKIVLSAAAAMPDELPEALKCHVYQEYICIRVADNGPGIDEETQKKIFDPFFTTKEEGHGTGIGLSMVYNVAFAHGGAVDVISAPGDGTVFLLYIEAMRDSLVPLD